MRSIAALPLENVRYEAIGRGWPPIEGWNVRDEFVSESELDVLIDTADCIVIPYRRFYQSGIAIRALESCTPIVGPTNTSLDPLLGKTSRLLVAPGQPWTSAVRFALETGRAPMAQIASSWHDRAIADWAAWANHGPLGN
ncbi:hypothetical protein [Microbacterium sp. R86528]|uniref:hypothetical protein n=1 Tax=Microbacterium sp. R86528 TaxID=3093864 RepID=UPI0037C853F5